MISDENREEANVTFAVYKKFFNQLGGVKTLVSQTILMILLTVAKVYCDYLFGEWAQSTE